MRRFIVWAILAGTVGMGALAAKAQESWGPKWRPRLAQAELPVPEGNSALRVPGPAEWEQGDGSYDTSQRVQELQAELHMLRQQMNGNMTAPPGGMPYPGMPPGMHPGGEVIYGPGEMPYHDDSMQPYPIEEGMVGPGPGPGPGHAGLGSCFAAVGPCCTNCSTCGPFSFGAEGVFFQPSFIGNEAFSVTNLAANNLALLNVVGTTITTPGNSLPFDWDGQASLRIWAAVKGCDGFGVRGRYWRLEDDVTVTQTLGATQLAFASVVRPNSAVFTPGRAVVLGLPGDTITASHSIDFATADVELVKDLMFPKAMLTLAAGVRYARNEQTYLVNTNGAGAANAAVNAIAARLGVAGVGGPSNLQHRHRFEGTGPTIAMELRRCLGCSGFSAFVNTRGSAIFGETDVWIGSQNTTAPYTANGFDETLLIGETSIGLQYSWHKLWLRAGYEAQYWMNTGNANTTGTDMGLVGFSASAGLGF